MRRLLAAVFVLLTALPALAQDGPDPSSADPEAAVRATVARLFDGMRARDSSMVASTLHPDARLLSVVREGERHRMIAGDLGRFKAALVASPVVWDERVDDIEVRVDDGLATAWMAYRFYAGDQFSHCGVNAMHLAQGADGWRIVHLMDTRREGCE